MLKSTKIVLGSFSVVSLCVGAYLFLHRKQQKPIVQKHISKKIYDTVPEKDSNLTKLNAILKVNKNFETEELVNHNVQIETYDNIDKNSSLYDSLIKAGLATDVNQEIGNHLNFEKGDKISTEKLIMKKEVTVIGTGKKNNSDSLAGTLAEIKTINQSRMNVEFWDSPLDYKGYRMGKEKLILFGVIADGVKLLKYKNEFWLITINNIYPLKPCSDFCKLIPVKDKTICTEIMRNVN